MNTVIEQQDLETLKRIFEKYSAKQEEINRVYRETLESKNREHEEKMSIIKSKVDSDLSACGDILARLKEII